MGHLQILPANIANMIAAGEVVQRPSSVVKELVENAVDAGATDVKVIISDSGRTLIQVIDNGCGMGEEDAQLCFERHATSKISSAEDLSRIQTYGFRGEALASIAAVSDVTLKTRREEDETAVQVEISGSEKPGENCTVSHVSAPRGSNFAVRNLFYNVPARRKFLKSDNSEFRHIVDEFIHVALTRPEIAFSLSHNGRDVYVLKAAKSLKFRILDLMGSSVATDVVDLESDSSIARINGFLGRPDGAKKTQGNQFFFVNGRYFRSAYFHKAVMKAYEELIPTGLTPSYFIYLQVDPESMDVNIHPTKTEIKFEDDSLLFQTLYACVRQTLGQNAFGAAIDFEAAADVQMPTSSAGFNGALAGGSPMPEFDPNYNPFDLSPVAALWGDEVPENEHEVKTSGSFGNSPSAWQAPKRESYGALFEGSSPVQGQPAMVFNSRYVLTQVATGLMIVNVRRASERILYEKFLEGFSQSGHISQSSLFPEKVRVGVRDRLVFDEHRDRLSRLGFSIQPFSDDCVVVEAVPEGYSCEPGKAEELVHNLLLILAGEYSSLEEVMATELASRLALLGASSASPVKTPYEAQKLLEALFACSNPEYTDKGKKIAEVIPFEDIDKRFQ